MKIIGIGDLVLDIYMNESEIKGITGGMSFANVIYNITRLLEDHNSSYNNNEDKKIDFETIIYGACGNDIPGDILIKELESGNINTSYISRKDNKKTREFYMYLDENDNFLTSKKKNYITKKESWYGSSLLNGDIPKELLSKDNIYVFREC